MKQMRIGDTESFDFCMGSCSCVYRLVVRDGGVLLYGEEANEGEIVACSCLSFPADETSSVEEFVQELARSQTMPRMMTELAEEYFSSAVLLE